MPRAYAGRRRGSAPTLSTAAAAGGDGTHRATSCPGRHPHIRTRRRRRVRGWRTPSQQLLSGPDSGRSRRQGVGTGAPGQVPVVPSARCPATTARTPGDQASGGPGGGQPGDPSSGAPRRTAHLAVGRRPACPPACAVHVRRAGAHEDARPGRPHQRPHRPEGRMRLPTGFRCTRRRVGSSTVAAEHAPCRRSRGCVWTTPTSSRAAGPAATGPHR